MEMGNKVREIVVEPEPKSIPVAEPVQVEEPIMVPEREEELV